MNLTVAGEPAVVYLLGSLRMLGWLALVPPFSNRGTPWMAKVVIAMALSFAAMPATSPLVPTNTMDLLATAVSEIAVGVTLGFITYMLFAAVAAAGSMIDLFGGFALASAFDPQTNSQATIMGRFHHMIAVALLFVSGGFLIVIGGVVKTYTYLPVGDWPQVETIGEVATIAFGLFFTTAVEIALPLILALIVVDLGLAMMTKVAPQLNAIMVMFPLKISVTLLLVGLSFTAIPGATDRLVDYVMEAMATIVGA